MVSVEAEGLRALPDLLVKARIAGGLTHRQLAERLGVADQAGSYARAGLDRLARVAEALGVRLRLTGTLGRADEPAHPPANAAAS